MKPHYADDDVTLYAGDCIEVMRGLPDNSVDAVVTDPPYGLDFMGKHWDTGAVAFSIGMWAEALRVLKPGGHLVAFGGTRTWHRLACAIEDAGFEIRDSLTWIYGRSFPKSLDVSKAIDKAAGAQREVTGTYKGASNIGQGSFNSYITTESGTPTDVPITAPATPEAQQWQGWGTALKPCHESIVLARKPLKATVAKNVLAYGTGALNIDGCRIPIGDDDPIHGAVFTVRPTRLGLNNVGFLSSNVDGQKVVADTSKGRWPPNVILDPAAAEALDRQGGDSSSGKPSPTAQYGTYEDADNSSIYRKGLGTATPNLPLYGDSGGVSRFFPVFDPPFYYQPKATTAERPSVDGIAHPTVKPLDLMRWLVRLITPPGGVVLEPFAGSGTTAEACVVEGFRCIAIEREADYLPLIVQRLTKPIERTLL